MLCCAVLTCAFYIDYVVYLKAEVGLATAEAYAGDGDGDGPGPGPGPGNSDGVISWDSGSGMYSCRMRCSP